MKPWILSSILTLLVSPLLAQGVVPEVDTAEVLRRGDMVTQAGTGIASNPDELAYLTAIAPPADDSHKWFVTVITSKTINTPQGEKLKSDFRNAPELLAFVAAPEEAKSWAHYNEYLAEDTTQQFRLKDYKLAGYPAIVLQPPRDGSWGSAATVVFQSSEYNGDSKKLADAIRSSIRAYSAKMHTLGYPKLAIKSPRLDSSVVVNGGARQQPAGVDPPFRQYTDPLPPDPRMPSQYPPASQVSPNGNPLSLLGLLISSLFGGQSLSMLAALAIFVNTAMYCWDWYRAWLKNQGKEPVFTDAQKAEIAAFLTSILGGQKPTSPPAP